MSMICSECQFESPKDAKECKRCKFPFNGEWNSLISKSVGNYKLVKRIGGGGFGAVYEARHVTLNNAFAVKILHPRLAEDPTMLDRFQQEAYVLAELRHEHVVQVIDFGFSEDIGFYLIMEWLEGRSLRRIWRSEPHPKRGWILSLFSQLLDALSYAHERGIVHRDLKPENMLITQGSRGRMVLKIVDFGIASILDHPSQGQGEQSKVAIGTPFYMAPEQVRGQVSEIGSHTDLYACGILLAELLTGQRVFAGKTLRDTMRLHLTSMPPTLAELNPKEEYSEALEMLVQKALQKAPQDRFQKATVFTEALEEVMEADEVTPITEDIYKELGPPISLEDQKKQRPQISYREFQRKPEPTTSNKWQWTALLIIILAMASIAFIWMTTPPPKQTGVKKPTPIRIAKGWGGNGKPGDSDFDSIDFPDSTPPDVKPVEKKIKEDVATPETTAKPDKKKSTRKAKTKRRRRSKRYRNKRKRARAKKKIVRTKKKIVEVRTPPPPRRKLPPLINLKLLSKPAGAQVFVSGKARGKTPVTIQVTKGQEVEITFKKKGYVSKSITRTPTKPGRYSVTLIEDLFE